MSNPDYDHRGYECNLFNCVEKPKKFSAFTAQLVRALHRYREVTVSRPIEVLNFLGFYTKLLTEIAFLTAMIIADFLMIFAVMSCYSSSRERPERPEKFNAERDSNLDLGDAGALPVEQPGQLGAGHYVGL